MPKVPTYDGFQVAPTSMAGARLEAPTLPDIAGQQAQQLGQGMQRLGGELGRILVDIQDRKDKAEAKDQDVSFTQKLNDLQFNPQTGYLNLQGKNAIEAHPAAVDTIKQLRQQTLDGIENPRVRELVDAAITDRSMAAINTLSRHTAQQNIHWQVQSSHDRAVTTLQDAASNYDNPKAFELSIGTALNEAKAQGELQGWDEATTRLQMAKYTDQAFKMRYEVWRQKDAAAALADFQQNADHLTPLTRKQVESELFPAAAPQLAAQINAAGGVGMISNTGPTGATGSARGERNNNPGNLVKSDTPWEGEVQGSDARFATFATPEAGIRAMGKNLLAYQDKHGIDTVEGVISRWAPATENDTSSYVAAVAKAAGVSPKDKINLHDSAMLTSITKAIIRFENGRQPYTDQQISLGLAAATGSAELPAPTVGASNPVTTAGWRDPEVRTGNPVVDALAPDQKLRVLQLAKSMAHQDMEAARTALHTRVQDAQAEYMAYGKATNPPTEAEFIQAYGQADGIVRYRALQDTATLGQQVQQIKTMSDADMQRLLVESQPVPGEGFAARQHNYQLLGKAIEQVQKMRNNDPVAVALNNSAYGIRPLTFIIPQAMAAQVGAQSLLIRDKDSAQAAATSMQTVTIPQVIAGEMKARAVVMDRISKDYGTPPAVMTNDEAAQFGDYINSLQAVDKARVLGQVAAAVGPVGMQSISAQLKDKNSTLAIAGALASKETTAGNSAARLYLEGKEMIAEKRAKIDASAETGIRANIFKAIEGVYLSPQAREAAADAAFGIYAKLKSEGSDDTDRAIRLATGGLMDFNGAKIAKPYGWTDAAFTDALKRPGLIPDGGRFLAGGHKLSAQDLAAMLPGARLQTFGDGSYLIKSGNDVVRRADGSPFILKVGS